MEILHTDGTQQDFINLCHMLDDYLNEISGGEKKREQYIQYNTVEDIHDVILIYDDNLPIACAGFKHYNSQVAEVKRVFIVESYRGRGISKLLMEELETEAKCKGYLSLILETGAPLVEAMGLYQSIGYKIIDNYGPYKNMPASICMRKDI